MRQGSFEWLVGSVLVVLPPAATWGQGRPDALGQAGIRGSSGACAVLFGERRLAADNSTTEEAGP